MTRKASWFSLFGAIAVLFAFSACTNNPYPETDDGQRVLYTSFSEAPKSLDPAVAYDTAAHEITGQVHDTLLEYHYLKRPYALIPGLATRVPKAQPEPDGSVLYEFELRPGALFQDDPCFELGGAGQRTREISAQDVAFELMRIADPLVNSPVIDPFSNLSGFAEFSERLTKLLKTEPSFKQLPARERYQRALPLPGVRVVDATHLELRLKTAYPQILYWFGMPFTTPVPWEAVEYYTGKNGHPHLADHPVASGPFLLSSYDKQSRMVLDRNPNWYGAKHPEWHAPGASYPSDGEDSDAAAGRLADAGKALPFLDRIDFRREKESIPAFTKFLEGYYDTSGIIRESFDKMVKDERLSPEMQALGMRLDKSVIAAVYYIGFNMDDAVVGSKAGERSKKLRQAMSLAVDVREYTRLFMNRRGVPAESVLPPGIFGYEPEYKNPYRQVDLAKAKALLTEAGFDSGTDPKTGKPLHLTFDTPDTSPDGRLRYQFFVNAWRQLGIDVEIAATNYNKFQEKVHDGAYQIFLWGWVADYPDAENFMFLLTSDMARTKNNGPNTANFSDPEFDRLFLAMKTRENDPERLEIIRKMRAIIQDQCPWIALYHPEDYTLLHAWVHNVKSAGLSVPTLKYDDLDPKIRHDKRAAWNKPVVWPAYALCALFALVIVPGVMTFFRERQ
ncbi:MAG TPA: ABC transporter substrate-binding protein [Polyangiaceae bacterium]|nr:ABC transporter substrate-binding protein [Polyangiaceae bacterium]